MTTSNSMPAIQGSQHPPGSVIGGRYAVENTLGRGGMGSVYRVRDAKTSRHVALKRSWSADSIKAARRRALLEREFHTLAHLRHPRIIEVYDYAVDEFGPYYTMELLDGADLDKAGPLPWQEACAMLRDVASSLAIVHSRGLIHRDVSARNVRRTADGRVKLLDFGALVSMGTVNDVVGTPPFMAPEVLQMQALDARADLFSLGALAYYLLTGRHAFAVRRSSELRDAWRSRPTPPSRAVPEIPAALSELVLSLLALDRGARPPTAAEVMERLCVIADLPKEELPEIQRGYLTTPTLVGRQAALLSIRTRMLSLVRGDGGALLLEGSAGSGRSRMLDASVFEGKLLSAVVVRAGAGDAIEPWGVARAITSQLFAQLPQQSVEAARLSAGVLAAVVEELRGVESSSVSVTFPERSLLLRELRDFVLALARKQRLLIAVDDADRIDEPSAAWLAALADKAERQKLMLVMALDSEHQTDAVASLQLFRSLAQRVPLPPLDAEQSEALLRSVFGDVPNLGLAAGRIHGLAQGNPRATMELAQHLVDSGLARYEGGTWSLPHLLGSADLPATLNDSFAQRLEALGPDARDLLEVLCCADGLVLPLGAYRALSAHRDQDRLFRAFEDLVSARILAADSERYRLSQRRFVPVVLAQMSAARTAALRGRLAELLAQNGGDVLDRAQQLMLAGRGDEMVQLLCSLDLQARQPPLALLESAVAHAERTAVLAPRAVHRLRMALLTKASVVVDLQSFRRHLPAATQQLERDSGLELYRELRDVPEAERLTQALSQQQQRYLATPPREQVYSVFDAVRELARLISATCGIASATFDVELLEALPSLEPFLALSPSLRVVEDLKGATLLWHSGGTHRASEIYEQILERITQPDRAGLEEVQVERMQLALQYILALLDASNGSDRAESRAQFLETRRAMRVNAWRVRSLLQLYQGDSAASQKSARRAELLQLQDERESHYLGTSAAFQLYANYLAGDLLGVKNAAELIARLAASYPGWQSTSVYAQSCYRYLLGDLDEALQLAEQGLLLARPGRNASWGLLAAQQVRVLRELGQLDRALGHARAYLELADRLQLTLAQRYLCMETSRALGEAGQHAEALAMLEPLLQLIEASGARGLVLGTLYEARAQIAISMGDRAAFELFAERCGQEYKQGNNAALLTKLIRLMERAQQRGLAEAAALPELTPQLAAVEQDHDDNTIVSRMLECVDAADRARCALTMLLQSCDAHLGYLYGASEDKLIALAGLPENTAEPALEGWLQGWVRTERDAIAQAEGVATATVSIVADSAELATETEDLRSATSSDYSDSSGRKFHAVLLTYDHHGKRTIAGVLAIQSDVPRRPPMSQLAMIAAQLLAHHDVRGIALGASA